jgi:hypothetical protein
MIYYLLELGLSYGPSEVKMVERYNIDVMFGSYGDNLSRSFRNIDRFRFESVRTRTGEIVTRLVIIEVGDSTVPQEFKSSLQPLQTVLKRWNAEDVDDPNWHYKWKLTKDGFDEIPMPKKKQGGMFMPGGVVTNMRKECSADPIKDLNKAVDAVSAKIYEDKIAKLEQELARLSEENEAEEAEYLDDIEEKDTQELEDVAQSIGIENNLIKTIRREVKKAVEKKRGLARDYQAAIKETVVSIPDELAKSESGRKELLRHRFKKTKAEDAVIDGGRDGKFRRTD